MTEPTPPQAPADDTDDELAQNPPPGGWPGGIAPKKRKAPEEKPTPAAPEKVEPEQGG